MARLPENYNPQKFYFELTAGGHQDADGIYGPGDLVAADYDLAARYGRSKFKALYAPSQPNRPARAPRTLPTASGAQARLIRPVKGKALRTLPTLSDAATPADVPYVDAGLDGLSVRELQALAEQNGIDVSACQGKDQLRATVKAVLEPTTVPTTSTDRTEEQLDGPTNE